jgi:adenylate kinase
MKSVKLRIVAVCGIPASGKTTFCEWLERERGFLHLDFDQLLCGRGNQLKLSLTDALRHESAKFISMISERGQSTVIDWGFPVMNLPIVRELRDAGVAIWWFDGDRTAARTAFRNRRTVPLPAFDAQVAAIESNWAKIREVIDDHVIQTIALGVTYTTPEWIFEKMFGQAK